MLTVKPDGTLLHQTDFFSGLSPQEQSASGWLVTSPGDGPERVVDRSGREK